MSTPPEVPKIDTKNKPQPENFILQYSPRTDFSMSLEEEEKLYTELKLNFDPITIKIVKKHFKERLGMLTKEEFVAILKNHLLAFIPGHPDRERIMIKLLSKLFSDIDLNDNGTLEWNEFTNYIIHSSNAKDKSQNNKDYRLKFYSASQYSIKPSDLSEMVTFAFFIEKYNVVGVVQEGKSTINFFDVKKCNKLKCQIDLRDIQGVVDILEFSELNNKAEMILEKEEEEKKIKRSKLQYAIDRGDRRLSSKITNPDELKKAKSPKQGDKRKNKNEHKLLSKEEIVKASVNKKLSILCAIFIAEYDLILVSGTNNTITAWQFNGGEVKNVNATKDFILFKDELRIAILIADSPQYSMIWDPQLKQLFTGQKDGRILKWDLTKPNNIAEDTFDIKIVKQKESGPKNSKSQNEREEAKKLKEQLKQKSLRHRGQIDTLFFNDKDKNETVSCLLLLQKLQLLAASYYSGYVVLWDTLLKDYRKYYCDQQTGIYSMAFDSVKNLLFTCGFDHDIYVYDPYIEGSCVYKLTGHSWSINSIDVNEKESEMLSLDILGNIKIWDSQLLINFQTIKLNEEFEDNAKKNHNLENSKNKKLSSNLRMLYIKKYKKILIYGSKLLFFETDRTNCPELADDQVICSCFFDKTSKTVLSFCLRKIKIWNILTGKVKQIYDDPMNNEITALTVDMNIKRGFLGDNTGKIKNINLRNGLPIKDLTSHNTEIKFICHSMTLNIVVSCSIDNVIKIHDDKELLETEVIKELSIFQFQVRSICIVDRFARLGIGLSNGVVKFYDIEHFHYDSDLASDSSIVKDEVSALAAIDDIELCLCCYSRGMCKFIVTPPSTAKFNTVFEFNNTTNENFPVAISAIEFDKKNHWCFIGDLLGHVKCYDIADIYKILKEVTDNEIRNFENEPKTTKENLKLFTQMKIKQLWSIEAHKESIKHIHYVELEPRIIITTSHDLRIKIFGAEDGKYKDEFKQSSNRTKPVPIGIKYFLLDPFGNEELRDDSEAFLYTRKDIEDFQPSAAQENESQQISEYSKKITEYNAKEKLWLNCRNTSIPYSMSNNWNLDIDVEKVKENEDKEFQELKEVVKKIEKITSETELILQDKSIYSESYKPKYIEEMNDIDSIKQFSKVISERLRHVKLAVSKANLNQSKMVDLTKKKKTIIKSKSAIDLGAIPEQNENTKQGDNNTNNTNNNLSSVNILKKKLMPLRPLRNRGRYGANKPKMNTLSEHFQKFNEDFHKGYKQIFLPFKLLMRKARDRKGRKKENEDDKEAEEYNERRRRFQSMEMGLRKLEQNECEY